MDLAKKFRSRANTSRYHGKASQIWLRYQRFKRGVNKQMWSQTVTYFSRTLDTSELELILLTSRFLEGVLYNLKGFSFRLKSLVFCFSKSCWFFCLSGHQSIFNRQNWTLPYYSISNLTFIFSDKLSENAYSMA